MKQKSPSSSDKLPRGDDKITGHALRSVYEETVREDIPPEMLDLLGKLE